MITDNVSQAVNRVTQVFWSGGLDEAGNHAQQVAQNVGGKTLEMTRVGQYLGQMSGVDSSVWNAASTNFANTARNMVYTVQNTPLLRPNSTWNQIEYPILLRNSKVFIQWINVSIFRK